MRDLTKDSIAGHMLLMAFPIALSVLAHTTSQLVDLYFISRNGAAAVVALSSTGNAIFIFTAISQVLSTGTVALVAFAVGRKDRRDINFAFNQSMSLAITAGMLTVVCLLLLVTPYLRAVSSEPAVISGGARFIQAVLPGYALLLPMAVFSSALRGLGIVRPSVLAYLLTVGINMLLAPILIAGWGTGKPLGLFGAGIGTSLSVSIGVLFLGISFHRAQKEMALRPHLLAPCIGQWRRTLVIGLSAGCDFLVVFLSSALVYYAIRDLGSHVQGGYGIGVRVQQLLLLPAIAIATAAAPIAGQNYGARNADRVRATFHIALLLAALPMVAFTGLAQQLPGELVSLFDAEPNTTAAAAEFLRMMSWTFVAQGIIYVCTTMFQSLDRWPPALIASGSRFIAFAIPAVWLSAQPTTTIHQVWYVLIASILLQAVIGPPLLRIEIAKASRNRSQLLSTAASNQ